MCVVIKKGEHPYTLAAAALRDHLEFMRDGEFDQEEWVILLGKKRQLEKALVESCKDLS